MAESNLYAGERAGPRIFRIGRIGFDQGTADLGSYVYTGTYRTERFAPAGVGALINFRRVAIHLLVSGDYIFTVRIWVDDERTSTSTDPEQVVIFTSADDAVLGEREVTREVELEAEGSHIQVEITVDSDDVDGIFLIEGIRARGRVIRRSSTRAGESS